MKKFFQKRTPKFLYLHKFFGSRPFRLLDVGAGNHSASKTKKLFPRCEYHGVDLQKDYNNDATDYAAMHSFYKTDLTQLEFDQIPDNYFDFIRMAHVIEHLYNGDEMIEHISSKLKRGGYIYIEYPGKRSTKLPSMQGTLNFYDDPTHIRIYSIPELKKPLSVSGFTLLKQGLRRSYIFICATPFRMLYALLKGKRFQGNYFWDILGFAELIVARKQ